MYNKVTVYESKGYNPYRNLAIEAALTDTAADDELIVYLWTNDNTVVIGKNQNAYLDVNVKKLYEEGGLLARRSTGGGAVYHDKGNLNFSFITGRKSYSLAQNNAVIVGAIRKFGLEAVVSGRNDIEIDGRKFSGNAYYKSKSAALHHGTLLINSDTAKMSEFLNVNPDKLNGKGVSSVKARVVNLAELHGQITAETMKNALKSILYESFSDVSEKSIESLDAARIDDYEKKFSNDDYVFGASVSLENNKYKKFDWGYADVHFTVSGGVISGLEIYSDCLDTQSVDTAKTELLGKRIVGNIDSDNQIAKDIARLLVE